MLKNNIRFSDVPRLRSDELKNKYPVTDYMQWKKRLNQQREIIKIVESRPEEHNRLADLYRKEKELQRMLDDAPPDPILPPPAPLIKVTGVIEQFAQRRVVNYFDSEAYAQTQKYFKKQKERQESDALGMAATGSPVMAQAMLLDSDRTPAQAWYITGMINGKRFSGWLGFSWCQEGEEVELIVAPWEDEYLVYAIHKPWEHSLAMPPLCYCGKRQGRKMMIRYPLVIISLGLTLLFFLVFWSDGYSVFRETGFYVFSLIMVAFCLFVVLLPAVFSIKYRTPFPCEELAEEIFTLLGWENVTDINLEKLNKKREQEWRNTGKPENPFKNYTPFDYSGTGYSYYYY